MIGAKLTDTGQPVIPKPIRDALPLGKGSELLVSIEGGRVVLEPRRQNSGKKLAEWLPALQVTRPGQKVDLNADVEDYREE